MSPRSQSVRKQFRFAVLDSARKGLLLVLLVVSVALRQHAAYAEDIGTTELERRTAVDRRCEETDRALTLELIKLAKFNVHFHLAANRHQVWRQFSYPALREAGTAGSFAKASYLGTL